MKKDLLSNDVPSHVRQDKEAPPYLFLSSPHTWPHGVWLPTMITVLLAMGALSKARALGYAFRISTSTSTLMP